MHPILWQWGSFIVPSWHAFFVLAAFAGWWSLGLWRKYAWPEGDARRIDNLFLITYITGYVGARGLSVVMEGHDLSISAGFLQLFQLGSMTLYGGIITASLAAILYSRQLQLNIQRLSDFAVPSTLLGIAIGRVGCFLNGDDFGRPILDQLNPAFWAVKFPNLADEIYRYPVQIWETFLCLGLAVFCWSRKSWLSQYPGRVGTLGVIGYAVSRFVLEYFRGDDRGYFLFDGLSPAQSISILIIAAWTMLTLRQAQKKPKQ